MGCGPFGAARTPASPTAKPASATVPVSAPPATVTGATYGPGETLGAVTVAHVIKPAVTALQSTTAPLRLAAVQLLTSQMGWAVGSRCAGSGRCQGIVLSTHNGGAAWSERVIAAAALTGVQFLDPQDGWAFGPDALYATDDGGVSWKRVALPAGLTSTTVLAASFVDPTDGWLVAHLRNCAGQGCGVRVYATADGGATWRLIARDALGGAQGSHGLPWAGYTAGGDLGGGHGWMLAQTPAGLMETTADGGQTWRRLQLSTGGAPVGGGFAPNGTGWVAATGTTGSPVTQVWSSPDEGTAWRMVTTIPGRVAALAAASDGAAAWVTLQGGAVSVVSALGTASAPVPAPPGYAILAVGALDATNAWAVASSAGSYAILATTDAGRAWHSVYHTTAAAVTPRGSLMGFVNGVDGWAVGSTTDATALLRTVDGGASWTVAGTVPVAGALAAGFSDPQHGWVADLQAAYVTANGGAAWSPLHLPLPKGGAIAAMGFPTPTNGWLLPAATKAQPAPRLLVSSDGGLAWRNTGAGPFLSVAFATPALGWAIARGAGADVHLMATTNGGFSWRAVADLGPQQWNPATASPPLWVGALLAASAPDDVWVASGGHLLQSTDGGRTWVDLRGPAAAGLVAAAGGFLWVRAGTALYSVTAGGRSWSQVGWAGGA